MGLLDTIPGDPRTDHPPPPSHTTETKQKEKHHSRMQGKWSEVRNFPSEERKQRKNHCSPVKLESKKNDQKIIDTGRDRARKLPTIVEEKPRPI